jgi:hypothetical protein
LKVPANDLFGTKEEESPLETENLLVGFALGNADTNIAFDNITSYILPKIKPTEDRKFLSLRSVIVSGFESFLPAAISGA